MSEGTRGEDGLGVQEGETEDEEVRQVGRSQKEQEPRESAGSRWKTSEGVRSLARGDRFLWSWLGPWIHQK